MQIGHLFGNYDNHNLQDGMKLENNKNTEQMSQIKTSGDISSLKEGMVFKGEILDIAGEKVTIRLDNDYNLPARIQGEVQLGIGDQLLFSVKENNTNQILIKPLFDSLYSAQTKVLEQALDLTGFSPTEKNFSAAKTLMDAGLSLDKSNMTKLLSQSMKFPDTSMSTFVSLNKMGIPVTAENIQQYERYESLQHQIAGDIDMVVDSMTNFSALFPQETDAVTVFSFVREMADIFANPMTVAREGEGQVIPGDLEMTSGNVAEDVFDANRFNQAQVDLPEEGSQSLIFSGDETEASEFNLQHTQNDTEQINDSVKVLVKQLGLTEKETTQMLQNIKELGVPQNILLQVVKNSNSSEQFLQNILSAIDQTMTNDSGLKQLLDSAEFKKLFSDVIQKNWSLNPNQMKDPKEIDDLYQRIQKQSRDFENALTAKGGDGKGFQENSQNMRQNMSFMEQINNQMIYAQMPLKLSNQNANSELFIYADKKKLMEKKDGISVMLHLDMDHLGQTDIKVTLTQSNVHARFYLNDDECVDIVTNHMEELAKQLGLRGFSLTNEVVRRKPAESINKVVDEIIDENAERSIKRYTFDART